MPPTIPPLLPKGHLRDREQPRLATGDVVLRPWSEHDGAFVVTAFADPAIQFWHGRTVDDLDEGRAFARACAQGWADDTDARFVLEHDGRPVGQVALRDVDLPTGWAELSYWVLPEARGAGIAVTAVRALATWAFDDLGMHRLEILHAVGNLPSCRVAEKAGFTLEGTLVRCLRHADGWHDTHLHAAVTELFERA